VENRLLYVDQETAEQKSFDASGGGVWPNRHITCSGWKS